MSGYSDYKAELAALCERGLIRRETKKRFSRFSGFSSAGETVFCVASELNAMFTECKRHSEEFAAVAELTVEFISGMSAELPELSEPSHDVAVVCAYLLLLADANSSDSPFRAFEILSARAGEFNMCLQNIKHGLRIFDAGAEV